MASIEVLWEEARFADLAKLEDEFLRTGDKRLSEAYAVCEMERRAEIGRQFQRPQLVSKKIKIVTILHTSLPHFPGGYSSRAHGLLSGLKSLGLDVVPYTRPGFYQDIVDRGQTEIIEEVYSGITYKHLYSKVQRSDGEYAYMLSAIEQYKDAFLNERPNIVHLRSTYLIALPAMIAAQELGIPVIYEISGLWELVYKGRNQIGDANRTEYLENLVVRNAESVVTMNQSMANLIESRNSEEKLEIGLVPNAVDISRFQEIASLDEFVGEFDFGYIGSLLDYEGLDVLIGAVARLIQSGTRTKVKIVGGGPELERLKSLVNKLALTEYIEFTGPVNSEEAIRHFQDIRCVVLPRISTPATENVTPLKPFEAMAAERPLIVSSVQALRELADNKKNALEFRAGDVDSLFHAMRRMKSDPHLGRYLARNASAILEQNYTWKVVASKMEQYCREIAKQSDSLPHNVSGRALQRHGKLSIGIGES